MQTWKKAAIIGGIGAGVVLAVSGRRSVGVAVMAGGLALLASEYPEKFETIWENGPDYVNRATKIFATLQQLSERFAEESERRSVAAYHEMRNEYGR